MDLDLKNKTVLITGGASGAGKQIVKVFADAGATIALTYHSTVPKQFPNTHAYPFDQRDLTQIPTLFQAVEKDLGKIDVLVTNAGIYPAKAMEKITQEDWDEMMETNARSVFFLNREAAHHMDSGSIINISSINAVNPASKLIHYGASKAAVEMITRCMAYELGPKIRVNCIAPGLIFKEGQERYIPGWTESYCERSALHRLVKPEEIGKTALFLASELSSAITGQTITVDCGVSLAPYFNNHLEDL